MNGTFRFGEVRPVDYFVTVALVSGIAFGLISSTDGFVAHAISLTQWTLQTTLGIGLIVLAHRGLQQFAAFERLGPWQQLLLSGLTGAALFTPPALMIDLVFEGEPLPASFAAVLLTALDEYTGAVVPMTVVWVAINAPFVMGFRFVHAPADPETAADAKEEATPDAVMPAFMQLVDVRHRGTVIYMKAELHYVLVVTDVGKELILYSLRDAIAELNLDGFQSHRSWWVNRRYVESFQREGRQGYLRLSTGERVPVARSQLQAAAALFSDAQQDL